MSRAGELHLASDLLQRALALSEELSALAERGEAAAAVSLDARRAELLSAVRASFRHLDARERDMLAEIAALNDRALGTLEHRLRIKARELDVAAAGRRAVAAYAETG